MVSQGSSKETAWFFNSLHIPLKGTHHLLLRTHVQVDQIGRPSLGLLAFSRASPAHGHRSMTVASAIPAFDRMWICLKMEGPDSRKRPGCGCGSKLKSWGCAGLSLRGSISGAILVHRFEPNPNA